jgi:co-chaperonin GroES (HSP10)
MFKPTKDRLLVRVEVEVLRKGEQPAAGGMLTADVLDVGPEVKAIKKGAQVVFAPYGIDEISVSLTGNPKDKEKLIVVGEELILGVYEGK